MANNIDNLGEVIGNGSLLTIGAVTGLFGTTLTEIDLLLGILLKSISIISFTVVIVINLPKFVEVLKDWVGGKK